MKNILKFMLESAEPDTLRPDIHLVELPIGSKIIHAGLDPRGDICIWTESDLNAKRCKRTIYLRGTGDHPPIDATHLQSFVMDEYVWHVYDGGEL
jgi:hypothetical protein